MFIQLKNLSFAKVVQTESRTTSLLDCYAEVPPIFCKDKKNIIMESKKGCEKIINH